MKSWLTIGQFSKMAGVSARALRLYEEEGLIQSHARGENDYRYFREDQLELVGRIKKFKGLGFALREIRAILDVDLTMNCDKLESFLEQRLKSLSTQEIELAKQRSQIEIILSSLKEKKGGLRPNERRYIMSYFEKVSVVVTGVRELKVTAEHIKSHLRRGGQEVSVQEWDGQSKLPTDRPSILVIPEKYLHLEAVTKINPDIVVIKELSAYSKEVEKAYLQLYGAAGPHMATIFNADDRASIELAANELVRRGKTYYFSKNSGLESQIRKIGGVVSDGEEIKIFGFNQTPAHLNIKLNKILGFDEEIALIASLAAVMDVGLEKESLSMGVS
jgi:DNA-binding transcriptional MerR regulator